MHRFLTPLLLLLVQKQRSHHGLTPLREAKFSKMRAAELSSGRSRNRVMTMMETLEINQNPSTNGEISSELSGLNRIFELKIRRLTKLGMSYFHSSAHDYSETSGTAIEKSKFLEMEQNLNHLLGQGFCKNLMPNQLPFSGLERQRKMHDS